MIWPEIVFWFLKIYQDLKRFAAQEQNIAEQFYVPHKNSQKWVKIRKPTDNNSSFDGMIQEYIDLSNIYQAVLCFIKTLPSIRPTLNQWKINSTFESIRTLVSKWLTPRRGERRRRPVHLENWHTFLIGHVVGVPALEARSGHLEGWGLPRSLRPVKFSFFHKATKI